MIHVCFPCNKITYEFVILIAGIYCIELNLEFKNILYSTILLLYDEIIIDNTYNVCASIYT